VNFSIDEKLWFGTLSDDAAEQAAAASMAARVGEIHGAKPFPAAAYELASKTRDPDFSLDDATRILEKDTALSASLLRLVNSAAYALSRSCTSVHHAAALVGGSRLNQLATTAAILNLFDASSAAAVQVLQHGSAVAAIGRHLAHLYGQPPDEMFTCGFLHDLGKLMLLETDGKSYSDLLTEDGDGFDAAHVAERRTLGFDHAVLGAHVLRAWNIPDPIPTVVAQHHQLARTLQSGRQDVAALVCLVRVADRISHAIETAADPASTAADIAAGEAARYMNVSEVQLAHSWVHFEALQAQSTFG
jgi:putative nucleotidyltransferase with HDIG domain